MHLEGVSVGMSRPITIGRTTQQTGIHKEPVSASIGVSNVGVSGDTIVDTVNHGGPDQAVYVYGRGDYDWWATQIDHELPAGMFGENLTISGLQTSTWAVGDRMIVGDLVLEATAPRIPCATFAAKMGIPGWVATFRAARRPGIYCRVITPGRLSAGANVEQQGGDGDRVGLLEIYDDWYDRTTDVLALDRFLAAPLAERLREQMRSRRAEAG